MTPSDADLARLDPADLGAQLSARLSALPPAAYLRSLAHLFAQYRRLYPATDEILDDIAALTLRAADGEPVQAAAQLLDGRLPERFPTELFKACGDLLWELTDEAHRYGSAKNIVDGIVGYEHPRDRLANTRMLLRLIDRAGRGGLARPIAATDPLIVRRAEPADTAGILDLLDDTAEWLGLEGVPDWLAWPDRRDAVPPAIAAGETWLLCTQAGDIAGTITLSTGDPGPGLWAESERRDSATYVSRLAVRPGLIGRGTGAWLLDWADLQADRNGSALLRVAAWPRVPRLHDCLRRRGFRPLWTVAAPPATSRTLFARRVQGAADLLRP